MTDSSKVAERYGRQLDLKKWEKNLLKTKYEPVTSSSGLQAGHQVLFIAEAEKIAQTKKVTKKTYSKNKLARLTAYPKLVKLMINFQRRTLEPKKKFVER